MTRSAKSIKVSTAASTMRPSGNHDGSEGMRLLASHQNGGLPGETRSGHCSLITSVSSSERQHLPMVPVSLGSHRTVLNQ